MSASLQEGSEAGDVPSSETVGSARVPPGLFSVGTAAAIRSPPIIPDYTLIRQIGQGGFGEVWLGRGILGQYRAVKIVYRDAFDQDKPYEREFEGLKNFEPISHTHESQINIFHVGRNDSNGYFYYVMELADPVEPIEQPTAAEAVQTEDVSVRQRSRATALPDGAIHPQAYKPRTLRHDLRAGRCWAFTDAVDIALSLTRALAHLHSHGLAHRDIKPSNIIFVRGVPKLADIGLVTSIEATRSFVGTDGYIPPEGPGTAQADIYSLGKVLYEVVTGKDRLDFPVLPEEWRTRPDFGQLLEFNEILAKACDLDPSQRYQSAAEMERDLALLHDGKSVRENRKKRERRALATRSLAVLLAFGMMAIVERALWREVNQTHAVQASMGRVDDGPDSPIEEANKLYKHAILLMRADASQEIGEAYTNLTEAVRLDTNFAKAYAALFELRVRETISGVPRPTHDELQALTTKLAQLAPSMAATHVALSFMEFFDWHYDKAIQECQKAISINSRYEFAQTHLGMMLIFGGDWKAAQDHLFNAEKIEQSKAVVQSLLGHTYYAQRDFENAIARQRQALRFKRDYGPSYEWIGQALQAKGLYTEAIDAFRTAALLDGGDPADVKASFDELHASFENYGEPGFWQTQLERTKRKPGSEFYWKAKVYAHLGEPKEAIYWLKRSYKSHETTDGVFHDIDSLLLDECWDRFHEDPQFKALVSKLGYPSR